MTRWLLAPSLLVLTSAVAPPADTDVPITALLATMTCGSGGIAPAGPTRLLEGYGPGGFTVRTAKPEAQSFFDNGMQLAQAFSHKAGIAAFAQARLIDPDCAMCAWGEAWSSGPTINYPIDDAKAKELAAIVEKAQALAKDGPALERELIAALKERYTGEKATRNRRFAAAIDAIAKANSDNDSLVVLAADAQMIAGDWSKASLAHPIALLEAVLARSPDYAPAIHFYIHATENAGVPERAVPYADKLARIAPAASHLVHMPSHTYYWVGRYADAARANINATAIGRADAAEAGLDADGVWSMGEYYKHNVHFGIAGGLISGDGESALALARPLIAWREKLGNVDWFTQLVAGEAMTALARFGDPAETLTLADPGAKNPVAQAMWHYARGEAMARSGDLNGLKREAKLLAGAGKREKSPQIARLAGLVLEARLALMTGKPGAALKPLRTALTIDDASPFSTSADPPMWWFPVRRLYAVALLRSGDATGAVAAADATLKRRADDPVALAVRGAAQAQLGTAEAAERDTAKARTVWLGDPAMLTGPLA